MKLSQRELADKIETTQATLQRYESGVHQPNIETLIKLADFFQVSIDDLVGRESETINIRNFDEKRKHLIKDLIDEEDLTIQRLDDVYNGIVVERYKEQYAELRKRLENNTNTLFNSSSIFGINQNNNLPDEFYKNSIIVNDVKMLRNSYRNDVRKQKQEDNNQ